MRGISRRMVLLLLGLPAFGVVAAGLAYLAWKHEPAFYRAALDTEAATLAHGSNELLEQASALVTDIRRQGEWRSLFTANQINGWLAFDLPKNHASLLPPGLEQPRVALEKGRIFVACRRAVGPVATVMAIEVEPYLLQPNELAVRICSARAGWIPLPLEPILQQITHATTEAELPLRWDQAGGDPVAVITLEPRRDDQRVLSVESLEIQAGELYVAGTTRTGDWPSADPGPDSAPKPPVLEARLPEDDEPAAR